MKRIHETRMVERLRECGFTATYVLTVEQKVRCADKAEADRAQSEYPSLVDWCEDVGAKEDVANA